MAYTTRRGQSRFGTGTNNGAQRANTTSEVVTNREFIVVCADKAGRVATFAENTTYISNYSVYSNDTKLNMFEQIREVLLAIPCNNETLLEKQVAIYVPGATFGNLGDMFRSDKYASCRDIMFEIQDLLHDRSLNCFTVDITGSKATIVKHAYDFVKEESKRANAKADGVEYSAPATASVSNATSNAINTYVQKIAETDMKIADAMLAGDTEELAKLESVKAMLTRACENFSVSIAPVATVAPVEKTTVEDFANVQL